MENVYDMIFRVQVRMFNILYLGNQQNAFISLSANMCHLHINRVRILSVTMVTMPLG